MKLLQYPFNCHDKNKESMIRMCKVFNIEFEATHNRNRIQDNNYDILWLPTEWIEPNEIPSHVKILYGPQHFVFPHPNDGKLCIAEDISIIADSSYDGKTTKWKLNIYELE